MIIEIDITKGMLKWAKEKSFNPEENERNDPELNKENKSPIVGKLYEAAFWKYYVTVRYRDKRDHDFILPDGQRVDCKAWYSACPPLTFYMCQAPTDAEKYYPRPTIFSFGCVSKDHTKAWLAGYIDAMWFFKHGARLPKGTVRYEPSFFVAKTDTTELPVSGLYSPETLIVDHAGCNRCVFFKFDGFQRWCSLLDMEVGERWDRGCSQFSDRDAKDLHKAGMVQ